MKESVFLRHIEFSLERRHVSIFSGDVDTIILQLYLSDSI